MDGSMYSCAGEQLSDHIFAEHEPTLKKSEDLSSLFEADVLPEEEIHVAQPNDDNTISAKTLAGQIRENEAGLPRQVKHSTQISLNAEVHNNANVVDVGKDGVRKQCAVVVPSLFADGANGILTSEGEKKCKNTAGPKGSSVQVRTQTVEEKSLAGKGQKQLEAAETAIAVEAKLICEHANRKMPAARSMAALTSQSPGVVVALDIPEQASRVVTISDENGEQVASISQTVMSSNAVEIVEDHKPEAPPTAVTVTSEAFKTTIDDAEKLFIDCNDQRALCLSDLPEKQKKNKRGNRRGKNRTKGRDKSDQDDRASPTSSMMRETRNNVNEQAKIRSEANEAPKEACCDDDLLLGAFQTSVTQMPLQLPLINPTSNNLMENAILADTVPTDLTTVDESKSVSYIALKQSTPFPIEIERPPSLDGSNSISKEQLQTVEYSESDEYPLKLQQITVESNNNENAIRTKEPSMIDLGSISNDIISPNDTIDNDIVTRKAADTGSGAIVAPIAMSNVPVSSTDVTGFLEYAGISPEGLQADSSYLESLANNANEHDQMGIVETINSSVTHCCNNAEIINFKAIDTNNVSTLNPDKSNQRILDGQEISTPNNELTNPAINEIFSSDTTYKVLEDTASLLQKEYGEMVRADKEPESGLPCNLGQSSDLNNVGQKACADTCDQASLLGCQKLSMNLVPHTDTSTASVTTINEIAMRLEDDRQKEKQSGVRASVKEFLTLGLHENSDNNKSLYQDTADAREQAKGSNIEHQITAKSCESIKPIEQRPSGSSEPSIDIHIARLEPSLDPMNEFTRLDEATKQAEEQASGAKTSLDKPPSKLLHREKNSFPQTFRKQIAKPKCMDQRENSCGKIERPSKMFREHSMSPIQFQRARTPADSLDTTADSISPDNSLIQDITYDIVNKERIQPMKSKKFTFGLEIPTTEPLTVVSTTFETSPIAPEMALNASYTVEKNVSEESLPLTSELEEDHPRSPSVQLSVSLLTPSNFEEPVKPVLMDLSTLISTSMESGQQIVKCVESELMSFVYLVDDQTVVALDKALQELPAGACRITLSYRVEPLDGPDTLPLDARNLCTRSPWLEASSSSLSANTVGSPSSCLSGRHGQKPAAIVSPMKPAMISRLSQTEVLHGDALEGYRLLEQSVSNLERTIQSTMSRMGEIRSANSELREIVQSQLDMLTEYKTQIEDLTFEKDQLITGKRELEEATEDTLRRERCSLDKQAALLRAQMEMKNMEIERLQQEARIMREQLSSCQKVINDLQQY
ncbi:uncharacterized protein LOC111246361 isoform X2 [Varroa destructor]|uniref:Uncharacterized protein n=1 Tax=Varroa destructor TaxID=109461 RepID=A0A7M7JV26_VARDE|nr:uncharacterized protein LOC111246361 isoform X2 [Varroa destructor]